ncbi:predicted protein [Arabidopsis lyrata subsp. lyrata]|uniref:Predicted protein n=1 Tax=Arabidopsis lyrata subsp. lyrata TaxID=81972 RepID=D7LKC6_ARALL|nr:predicted protein [Arabidopsis lyrata subsp. lyrata]
MAMSSLDEFVILVVNQREASSSSQEISISASEIVSWGLSKILSYGRVKVRARQVFMLLISTLDLYWLIEESSYFHGLLSGSFSESGLDHISVEWNPETFLNLLMCLYGYSIDITSSSLFDVRFFWRICARSLCGLSFKEFRMYHLLFQFILPSSIKHPHLTVDSEMHLADALLIWLDAGRRMSDFSESSSSQDNTINLMEQLTFRSQPSGKW